LGGGKGREPALTLLLLSPFLPKPGLCILVRKTGMEMFTKGSVMCMMTMSEIDKEKTPLEVDSRQEHIVIRSTMSVWNQDQEPL